MKESQPNYLFNTAILANFFKSINPSLQNYCTPSNLNQFNYGSPKYSTNNTKHPQQIPARLRVFHSSQATDKFNVYVNGNPIVKNLSYKEASQYLFIPPGKHQIRLCSTGDIHQPILEKDIILGPNRYYTLVTTANARDTRMIAFEDLPTVPVGEAKVRFLNLSSTSNEIDIAVKNRDVIFSNLNAGNGTTYLGITPMNLELEARKAGTKEVVINLPLLRFKPNTAYSVLLLEDDVILLNE